jgi:hypothetical protein
MAGLTTNVFTVRVLRAPNLVHFQILGELKDTSHIHGTAQRYESLTSAASCDHQCVGLNAYLLGMTPL